MSVSRFGYTECRVAEMGTHPRGVVPYERMQKLPRVICHMMSTVDGRVLTEHWKLSVQGDAQYEAVHALHRADAWMCGRQTFQKDFLGQARDAKFSRSGRVPAGDFIASNSHAPGPRVSTGASKARLTYAVAVDAAGKLRWKSSDMRGDILIVLTTKRAPNGYLADLRAKNISYLHCGDSEVNFHSALARLQKNFGIRKVMVEGGGKLNGALLEAKLLDELSLLVCPFADGYANVPTLFDRPNAAATPRAKASPLRFVSATERSGGLVWLRYHFKR